MEIKGKTLCESCFCETKNETCPSCGYHKGIGAGFPSALPVGAILIGKYMVGKVLGKGGFGITYLGYDMAGKKRVAIKEYLPDTLIHRNSGDIMVSVYTGEKEEMFKSGAEKFYEEAKTVSKFNGHPNIINVYEFFYENNTAYFVMEYVDGVDLKRHIKQKGGKLSVRETVEIVIQMLDTLMIVHSVGILHRDISPDNIYITNEGTIKLLDFGAARQVFGEQSKSLSIVLKRAFAPLEQYQTRGRQGPWSDIYALGATMYYAICGKAPEESMNRIDDDKLELPSALGIDIEPEAERIIEKMLALRQDDRYQSALAVKNDLYAVLKGEPVDEVTEPVAQVTGKMKGKKIAIIACAAGLTVVLAISAAVMLMNNNPAVPVDTVPVSEYTDDTTPVSTDEHKSEDILYPQENFDNEVTLVWYIPSSGEPLGWREVETQVNKILKEKINAKLEMKFIQWGDYETKMQMIMSSREAYDLCFTSTWINKAAPNISKGAYLSIDDLLQYTPRLKSLFTNSMWEASRFGGRIYGVPSLQVMYDQRGWWFKRTESEKYGLDVYGVKSFSDMSDIFAVIKENEPELIVAREGEPSLFTPLCTKFEEAFYIKDGKIYDYVDMFTDALPYMRDWYLKGYFPPDAATLQDDQPLKKAGKIYSSYQRFAPGGEAANRVSYDYDTCLVATGEPLISGDSVKSALTAVSATSRNPIRALKLVELMNTDKELFNLMSSGIEGRDYTRDRYNSNRKSENITNYGIPAFLFGNSFLALILPGYPDDIYEQTIAANESAPLDPNTGFSFNTSKVENEMSQLSAVNLEFGRLIKCGLEDTDTLVANFKKKFSQAGYAKVEAELKSQYNAWKAGR